MFTSESLIFADEIDQRNHKVRISFVLPFIDPSEFDPYFGDFQYLMTSAARSRLKGYLRTFVYMTICGLLLMFGGAAFFIRESIEIAEDVKDNNGIMTSQSNHSTIKSDSNYHSQVRKEKSVSAACKPALKVCWSCILFAICCTFILPSPKSDQSAITSSLWTYQPLDGLTGHSVYHCRMGESRLVLFPTAQQEIFQTRSSH